MEVAGRSNPSFRRVLVFCLFLSIRHSAQECVQLPGPTGLDLGFDCIADEEKFQTTCDNVYIRGKLGKFSCELDTSFIDVPCDRDLVRTAFSSRDLLRANPYCTITPMFNSTTCNSAEKADRASSCEQLGPERWRYDCYFLVTDDKENTNPMCSVYCRLKGGPKKFQRIYSKQCDNLTLVNETLTTAPPPPAKPITPKEEFPLWAAILIALGIAGLIALVAFLVWRKRRQAQGPAQAPEGGAAEAEGEGEGEGEGEDEGEGEEAEEASAEESQQPEEAAEGGGEAPAEE